MLCPLLLELYSQKHVGRRFRAFGEYVLVGHATIEWVMLRT